MLGWYKYTPRGESLRIGFLACVFESAKAKRGFVKCAQSWDSIRAALFDSWSEMASVELDQFDLIRSSTIAHVVYCATKVS